MFTVNEAIERLLPHFKLLASKTIRIELALGRVLAEDIIADDALPPFSNSSMDGYAVRAADALPGVELTVIGDIPAGSFPTFAIGDHQAARIMTGAPMPDGADAVVPDENTESSDQKHMTTAAPKSVRLTSKAQAGDYVRAVGEDVQPGQTILKAGRVLRAPDLGVLAGLGKGKVSVIKRPLVALLSTGDELLKIDQPLSPGKMVSTSPGLSSAPFFI